MILIGNGHRIGFSNPHVELLHMSGSPINRLLVWKDSKSTFWSAYVAARRKRMQIFRRARQSIDVFEKQLNFLSLSFLCLQLKMKR